MVPDRVPDLSPGRQCVHAGAEVARALDAGADAHARLLQRHGPEMDRPLRRRAVEDVRWHAV